MSYSKNVLVVFIFEGPLRDVSVYGKMLTQVLYGLHKEDTYSNLSLPCVDTYNPCLNSLTEKLTIATWT